MVIGHVDRAARRLAERTDPKLQMIVDPDLLLDAEQVAKIRAHVTQAPFDAAQRFLPAEAVRNQNDERF